MASTSSRTRFAVLALLLLTAGSAFSTDKLIALTFDNGPECLDIVSGWRGTRVSLGVSQQLASATSCVSVQQEVRLRLLRRAP